MRDLDLVREILLRVEQEPMPAAGVRVELDDYDRATIAQHVELLQDAAFVEANVLRSNVGAVDATVFRITNQGYDYLDSIREPRVWKQVKAALVPVGGTATLEIVKQTAKRVAADVLGLDGN